MRKIIYISLVAALAGVSLYGFLARENNSIQGSLGGEELTLKVADTEALREQGLSGSSPLSPHEGMLFIFPHSDNYGFWMKDMLFPIDIIWLDEHYRIVGTEERATPESFPKVFNPAVSSKYVVELRAGFISEHHLQRGDLLEIKK